MKLRAPRILVCGTLKGRGLEILETAGCDVDYQPEHKPGSLADVIEPFAGVIVHSRHFVDAATINAGPALRVVGRAGVGVDNIDVQAATEAGVLVMNLPWGNTITAAEHTVALTLALARNIPQASAALRAGTWDRKPYLGVELSGKILGVIGFGRIGREVARRAHGFEMKVIASDPYVSERVAADVGIEIVSLAELLSRADVLTVHVPLSSETHHLIDADALAAMKPGAKVINCARGGLVDEKALLASLESGHTGGAAFDVFEKEPGVDLDLLAHPHFIGTPHLGGATLEAQEKIGEGIAQQLADFLCEGTIHHAINVRALSPEEQSPMLPYMDLARRLGSIMSQCFSGIDTLYIEYFGEIAQYTVKAVSASLLVGFFEPHLAGSVNVINAWNVARDRDVEIEESTNKATRGYSSLLRVTGRTADGEHVVAGTVFDEGRSRIVELEGLPIELAPAGHLLMFANDDRSGVVGAVGTFLGERDINIAEIHLARTEESDKAIAVMKLDSAVDTDTLREFKDLQVIHWARYLKL
jgi:D-3-phosphoglycerate dehydrogenase